MKTFLITFYSTFHAIRFEKAMRESGYEPFSIPVPREISTSCGIAVRCTGEDADFINDFAKGSGLQFDKLYEIVIDQETKKKTYIKLQNNSDFT